MWNPIHKPFNYTYCHWSGHGLTDLRVVPKPLIYHRTKNAKLVIAVGVTEWD